MMLCLGTLKIVHWPETASLQVLLPFAKMSRWEVLKSLKTSDETSLTIRCLLEFFSENLGVERCRCSAANNLGELSQNLGAANPLL